MFRPASRNSAWLPGGDALGRLACQCLVRLTHGSSTMDWGRSGVDAKNGLPVMSELLSPLIGDLAVGWHGGAAFDGVGLCSRLSLVEELSRSSVRHSRHPCGLPLYDGRTFGCSVNTVAG